MLAPSTTLGPGPLEAVIAVTQSLGTESFPADIVLTIGRGYDDTARSCVLEDDTFHGTEAGRVEVLDDLDQRSDIEAREALVSIQQGSLHQLDALSLRLRERIEA